MPVQDTWSPILQAFFEGRRLREAIEGRKFQQERQLEGDKLEQQKFEEAKKQFQSRLAWEQEHGRAQLKLSEALQNLHNVQLKAQLEEQMGRGLLPSTGVEFRQGVDPNSQEMTSQLGMTGKVPPGVLQYINTDLMPGTTLRSLPPGETGEAVASFQEPEMKLKQAVDIAKILQQFKLNSALEDKRQEGRIALEDTKAKNRKILEDFKQQQANYRAGLQNQGFKINNKADNIVKEHNNHALTKRGLVASEALQFVNNLSDKTTSSADDIGLIYAFAKAMDPESVVREGEYNTVQKYAQAWKEKFGFDVARIFKNKEFLTEQARQNLKRTIGSKAGATFNLYKDYRNQVTGRINRITGGDEGETYLGPLLNIENLNSLVQTRTNSKTAIRLDDGTIIPDNEANRKKYGL